MSKGPVETALHFDRTPVYHQSCPSRPALSPRGRTAWFLRRESISAGPRSSHLAPFPLVWLRRSETRPVRRSESRPLEGRSFYVF